MRDLQKAGLKVTTDPEFSDKVKKGFAIRTVPKEGASVTKGTRVRLLVSQGPEQVDRPGRDRRCRRPRRNPACATRTSSWRSTSRTPRTCRRAT